MDKPSKRRGVPGEARAVIRLMVSSIIDKFGKERAIQNSNWVRNIVTVEVREELGRQLKG